MSISYWWSFGTKPLSLMVSKIFNVKCNAMVDVTLIRPLNKGQGHSFWYQSLPHTFMTSYRLSIVTFALRRTVATIHSTDKRCETDDRRKPVAYGRLRSSDKLSSRRHCCKFTYCVMQSGEFNEQLLCNSNNGI